MARYFNISLATLLLTTLTTTVKADPERSNTATPAPAMAEDQRMLPYIEPGQLVDIGGRHINMHCVGTGAPTVVLMAGLFSWSVVWYKIQPVIAQKTRVCAFDRASYGFSDPAPRPQILCSAASIPPLEGGPPTRRFRLSRI